MARIYTNYLNDGRAGCTWASLVATTLDCSTTHWTTCRQIAEEILPVPTASLMSQVNAALDKLIDNKLVAYRKNQGQPDGSRWEYQLTHAGSQHFNYQEGPWRPAEHSDSKLFQPNPKKAPKRRNNVVRFRPVRRVG